MKKLFSLIASLVAVIAQAQNPPITYTTTAGGVVQAGTNVTVVTNGSVFTVSSTAVSTSSTTVTNANPSQFTFDGVPATLSLKNGAYSTNLINKGEFTLAADPLNPGTPHFDFNVGGIVMDNNDFMHAKRFYALSTEMFDPNQLVWREWVLTNGGSSSMTVYSTNIVGLVASTGGEVLDAGGVPTTLTMQLPMTGRRAFVHPNYVNLKTNLHGYQYWGSVGTGLTTDTTPTAFEWPQAMKSHDLINWEPAGSYPTIDRTNALAVAGLSSIGWVADNETYVAPDGTIQMLFSCFQGTAPYTAPFYSTLMAASSVDGTNWTLSVVHTNVNNNGGGLTNFATYAGPQVVRDHTNGLRLYYVDDGQTTYGTNVLKWVPGLDDSGTNWNWASETSCTLATFGTRFYAPWHFSMNCVDGTYYMMFGNQGSSWGEYSTSTDGITFTPAGGGLFSNPGLFTGNEFASYKSAFRPVPGPNGLAWDVLLGATPQDQAQTQYVSGWNIKVLRGYQVDVAKLSYNAGNTNWTLFGADKNLGSVNRVGGLTVTDGGATSGLGSPFGGWAGLALGYNSPMASTNYVLASDGVTETRLNTRSGGKLNFSANNSVMGGFGTGGGFTVGSATDNSLTTGQLKASNLIASASIQTRDLDVTNEFQMTGAIGSVQAKVGAGPSFEFMNPVVATTFTGNGSGLTNVPRSSIALLSVPKSFRAQQRVATDLIRAVRNNSDYDVLGDMVLGSECYVDVATGSDANTGSATAPFRTLSKGVKCGSNTVWVAAGHYDRTDGTDGTAISNSVNILKWGPGNVYVSKRVQGLTYTNDSTYTACWVTVRSSTAAVLDAGLQNTNGDFLLYSNVATVASCNSNPGTWFQSGSGLWIHTADGRPADTNCWVQINERTLWWTNAAAAELRIYLHGLTVIGAKGLEVDASAGQIVSVRARDCTFLYNTVNAVGLTGVQDAQLQNCIAAYAVQDGFNYHSGAGQVPTALEINCVGRDNGTADGVDNDNGSSIHDGGSIVRLWGQYYRNWGPNVIEADTNTMSYNVGCVSFSSRGTNTSAGFSGSSGSYMWLNRCTATNNATDVLRGTGLGMFVTNCTWTTGSPTNGYAETDWLLTSDLSKISVQSLVARTITNAGTLTASNVVATAGAIYYQILAAAPAVSGNYATTWVSNIAAPTFYMTTTNGTVKIGGN